ncbi:hypothetical protein NDU88_001402 [Pleurodeles waltl]|uniref:Uncharacterized protein n=1 Tax=Pleurodeles waltl TaxID=8319 RepID=A0AAV7Q3J5_PLEWA|nr:hypothetical protein NDU88_001402 [Pleurodeles waltl]
MWDPGKSEASGEKTQDPLRSGAVIKNTRDPRTLGAGTRKVLDLSDGHRRSNGSQEATEFTQGPSMSQEGRGVTRYGISL